MVIKTKKVMPFEYKKFKESIELVLSQLRERIIFVEVPEGTKG